MVQAARRTTMRRAGPLCVAVDARARAPAERLVAATRPYAGAFKVGLTTFTALGPGFLSELAARDPVFADLKLHDIPGQVAGAVASVRELGASYVTVHASGGPAMVAAAAQESGDSVAVLAVTVLTSLGPADLERLGWTGTPRDAVLRLGASALAAGAHGLVCSPLEVAAVRAEFGPEPVLAVPGIRGPGHDSDDQVRTAGPAEALAAGADLLVVGRPISSAPDPARAAKALLERLRSDRR